MIIRAVWFGLGFALIGVSAWALHPLAADASAKPSAPVAGLGFNPVLSAPRPGHSRPAMRPAMGPARHPAGFHAGVHPAIGRSAGPAFLPTINRRSSSSRMNMAATEDEVAGSEVPSDVGDSSIVEEVTTMGDTVPDGVKRKVNEIRHKKDDTDIFKVFEKLIEPLQYVAKDTLRVRYALPMVARVGYFLGQGVTLNAIGISPQRAMSGDLSAITGQVATADGEPTGLNANSVLGALKDALLADDIDLLANPDVHELSNTATDDEVQRDLFAKHFASIVGLLKKDLKNIENGEYKLPYDLEPQLTVGKTGVLPVRQWNPLAVSKQLAEYAQDRKLVLDRMERKDGLEFQKNWKSNMYPAYYLQNFHYQTDAWLSTKSARMYDYQVESLFLGTADAMRRQVMPELNRYIKELGTEPKNIKVLDAATGTGRFASFVMDNNPDLDATVMDLSPFYLEEARKLLKRFPQVNFMQAAVEDIAADHATYDAITCTYLFHELPLEVRRSALKEFFRTLKPGGKLFFVDSAQKGEVPYNRVLQGFTLIAHEPYYVNYSEMDLPGMMKEVGFHIESEKVHWVSKSIVAVKPERPADPFPNEAEVPADPLYEEPTLPAADE